MKVPSSSLAATYAASVAVPRAVTNFVIYRSSEVAAKDKSPGGIPGVIEVVKDKIVESIPVTKPAAKIVSKLASFSNWKKYIEQDAQSLWRSLHRLVSVHPLVRSTLSNQKSSASLAAICSTTDLTQDLYLLLLEKGRFEHYLQSQMSDAEIEREIFQIELTNFLIGRLRRRRPENYRIVRRVSGVLESAPQFKVFHKKDGQTGRYRQAAEVVYGLCEWVDQKPMKDSGTFAELIAHLPMRARNRRRVGCRGDAQVIVTNQELVELMSEILQALDSPAPLRILRQLALSKLPVYDAEINSLDDDTNEERQGQKQVAAIVSAEASPEAIALAQEAEQVARSAARKFLDGLHLLNKSNMQRTERLWRVLWHCFFDPKEPSQLLIAEMVGISDSSVSDYRRKLESELRKLNLTVSQMRHFTEELDEQLRKRLALPKWHSPQSPKTELEIVWLPYDFKTNRLGAMHAA
jgi:hypothetical protein